MGPSANIGCKSAWGVRQCSIKEWAKRPNYGWEEGTKKDKKPEFLWKSLDRSPENREGWLLLAG